MTQAFGLFSAWDHAKSVMTLCFFLGIIIYVFDCTVGVRVYRVLYNLGHGKDKQMPADVRKGFLYRQSSRRMVFVVSVIEVWYISKLIGTYGLLGLDYFSEAFVWILLPFVLPAGFYLAGPWVHKLMGYFNPFIHKVDELNQFEKPVDLSKVTEFVRGITSWFGTGRTAPHAPPPKPEPAPQPKEEPRPSFSEALEKYRRH